MRHDPKPKACPACSTTFYPTRGGAGWTKYCSYACRDKVWSEKCKAEYPSKEELVRLYVDENQTDAEIARIYGRSAGWVLNARRHHGISARQAAVRRRNPKSPPGALRWGLAIKGEFRCRSCGGEAHHLHHIVPRSKSRLGREEVAGNGMPLCARCHQGWHDGSVIIFRDRLQPQELAWALEHGGPVWVEAKYPYRPDVALRRMAAVARDEDPEALEDAATEAESLEIAAMVNAFESAGG